MSNTEKAETGSRIVASEYRFDDCTERYSDNQTRKLNAVKQKRQAPKRTASEEMQIEAVRAIGHLKEFGKQKRAEFQFSQKEKTAAWIVDQLCTIFAEETKTHVSPTLFKRLTVKLSELLEEC